MAPAKIVPKREPADVFALSPQTDAVVYRRGCFLRRGTRESFRLSDVELRKLAVAAAVIFPEVVGAVLSLSDAETPDSPSEP